MTIALRVAGDLGRSTGILPVGVARGTSLGRTSTGEERMCLRWISQREDEAEKPSGPGNRPTRHGQDARGANKFISIRLTVLLAYCNTVLMEPDRYSLRDLAERVNAWCEKHGIEPAVGQAGEAVTERNVRYYRMVGLLDAPSSGLAGYGEKHFLQVVGVRLLQSQGLPLRRIRELLFGRSIAELRELQRRALAESRRAPNWRNAVPRADELWRMIPLSDDFMIVSRRGQELSARQRAAVLVALHPSHRPSHSPL